VAKATVCKTVTPRFESGCRLHYFGDRYLVRRRGGCGAFSTAQLSRNMIPADVGHGAPMLQRIEDPCVGPNNPGPNRKEIDTTLADP
jgi:hypothetical protein